MWITIATFKKNYKPEVALKSLNPGTLESALASTMGLSLVWNSPTVKDESA